MAPPHSHHISGRNSFNHDPSAKFYYSTALHSFLFTRMILFTTQSRVTYYNSRLAKLVQENLPTPSHAPEISKKRKRQPKPLDNIIRSSHERVIFRLFPARTTFLFALKEFRDDDASGFVFPHPLLNPTLFRRGAIRF